MDKKETIEYYSRMENLEIEIADEDIQNKITDIAAIFINISPCVGFFSVTIPTLTTKSPAPLGLIFVNSPAIFGDK